MRDALRGPGRTPRPSLGARDAKPNAGWFAVSPDTAEAPASPLRTAGSRQVPALALGFCRQLLQRNLTAYSLTAYSLSTCASWRRRIALAVFLAVTLALDLPAAVEVATGRRQETPTARGKRIVQPVTLANEVSTYTLTYDIVELPDRRDEIASHWWIWTLDYVTLGMTEPSQANWYFQGFFNWTFDGEALHNRPAVMRVLRGGGQDGVVEYVWDTPKVKATLRFALQSNSDKLLLYGTYAAKQPVKESWIKLTCYPTGFAEPRQRAVTTAAGTATPGQTVSLDLARQRWVLYEDTTPQRPGCGPAGLIVGTPDAFASITIPVGSYGIDTKLVLKPDAHSFAIGLYDYPTLPDGEQARAYFRASADAEAAQLQASAPGGFLEPLPPGLLPESRRVAVLDHGRELLKREVERWQPNPAPLRFPWAYEAPAARPIRTVLFCPRYRAYETMELARRVNLQVEHLYWDSSTAISQGDAWPYAQQTGQGPLGVGPAAALASALCSQESTELFLCTEISAASLPGPARVALLERVHAGAGLFLAGRPDTVATWPKELFADRDEPLGATALNALPWRDLPGFNPAEPPLAAYRYGSGAVVVLRTRLADYSALVPRHDDIEGRDGATDRCLALCARATLAAAGRLGFHALQFGDLAPDRRHIAVVLATPPAPGSTLLARVTDDLDRELSLRSVAVAGSVVNVPLPLLPGGRRAWLDVLLRDGQGRHVDVFSMRLPEAAAPALTAIDLEPIRQDHPAATPQVSLPAGGPLHVRLALTPEADLAGARVVCEVRDAFERLLARAAAPAVAETRLSLILPRPLTVCHRLDAWVERDGDVLAFARRRFTLPLAYPYDDFTVLLWSYAGGEPVLQQTDRAGYELGADMMDLCHMGGYGDAAAARQYELSSRSGLRVLPYVTRLSGEADAQHVRQPCLHDPEYLRRTDEQLRIQARQAAPYSPAAFTLGDENYLLDSQGEGCSSPATMAAFRAWLLDKYGTLDALNAAWATTHTDLAQITAPMLIEEAARQATSFAPWLDHRLFMDTAFAAAHEHFAGAIQSVLPAAKVGWDGLLGYHWLAGYDFTKLCSPRLLLNQTYTTDWLQGELVRSFKAPGALTGKWGNADADNAAGFAAWPWTCLLAGDNSVWWWTSWGCDYIPFNPDLSPSQFGRWFFPAVREVSAGPGRLLLHAFRRHSGIGVLYSQPDQFATVLLERLGAPTEVAGDGRLQQTQAALLKLLHDLGYEARFVSYRDLEAGKLPADEFRLLILTGALCLSDRQAATLRGFVEAGGSLLAEGRTGLLTGDGRMRASAALDELLGVTSPAGRPGLNAALADATLSGGVLKGTRVRLLAPGLRLAGAEALWPAGEGVACATRPLGKGRAFTLNLPWTTLAGDRLADSPSPLRDALAELLAGTGLEPPARLSLAGGRRPKATRLTLFEDGGLRYLGVEQDFRLPSLADQSAHLVLPAPAVVYDLRAGKRLGSGPLREWDITLSRGRPLLFSLLPYEVGDLQATAAAAEVKTGESVQVHVRLGTGAAAPGFHVVRLDVFAPGATTPHRQYSCNVPCPAGTGTAEFPLALNDPPGPWRLELRDVASGVRAAPLTLQVQE